MAGRDEDRPLKNRIAPSTRTTIPLITALQVAAWLWLKFRTQGEMIIQIPNSALIPDNQTTLLTSFLDFISNLPRHQRMIRESTHTR